MCVCVCVSVCVCVCVCVLCVCVCVSDLVASPSSSAEPSEDHVPLDYHHQHHCSWSPANTLGKGKRHTSIRQAGSWLLEQHYISQTEQMQRHLYVHSLNRYTCMYHMQHLMVGVDLLNQHPLQRRTAAVHTCI